MTRLVVVLLLAAEPNATVTPCGNAACVSTSGTPVTLGGTVQVNQTSWPDGGFAVVEPVVPGAQLWVRGNQADPLDGGNNATANVVLGSKNSLSSKDVLVAIQNRTTVAARFGAASSFGRLLDGGSQTATVPLGAGCICQDVTDNTKGVKAPVSTNTATISGTTGDQVWCHCF